LRKTYIGLRFDKVNRKVLTCIDNRAVRMEIKAEDIGHSRAINCLVLSGHLTDLLFIVIDVEIIIAL